MFNFTPSEIKALLFVIIVLLVSGTYQLISPHKSLQPSFDYTKSDSIFKRLSNDTIPFENMNDINSEEVIKSIKTEKKNIKSPEKEILLPFSININTASEKELQKLPRIGPAMSKRIAEYRDTNGKFIKIDDLLYVKGIGEKTLAKLKPYLIIK